MKLNVRVDRKARIEMLPLIDIVFLLLVFFIYAMLSMAVHHGLPVTLPTSTVTDPEKSLILSVTIDHDGMIHVDKEPVALEDLTRILEMKTKGRKNPGVLLFADSRLSYQDLFHVLDRIKMAGLNRISLQADAENQAEVENQAGVKNR